MKNKRKTNTPKTKSKKTKSTQKKSTTKTTSKKPQLRLTKKHQTELTKMALKNPLLKEFLEFVHFHEAREPAYNLLDRKIRVFYETKL